MKTNAAHLPLITVFRLMKVHAPGFLTGIFLTALVLLTTPCAAADEDIMTILRPGVKLDSPASPKKKATRNKRPVRRKPVSPKPAPKTGDNQKPASDGVAASKADTDKNSTKTESDKAQKNNVQSPVMPENTAQSPVPANDRITEQPPSDADSPLGEPENNFPVSSNDNQAAFDRYGEEQSQATIKLPMPGNTSVNGETRPFRSLQMTPAQEAIPSSPLPVSLPDNGTQNIDAGNENEAELTLQGPQTPDSIALEAGINLFNAGEYRAAIERFNQFLTNYPNSQLRDQTTLWLARAYLKTNENVEALMQLDRISDDSGEYPTALFLKGKAYVGMKENESARQAYHQAALLFPGNDNADNALLEMARLYLQDGNGERAIASVVQIIQQYPDSDSADDALYLAGKVYETDSMLRDVEKARLIYKKFLNLAEVDMVPLYSNSPLLERVRRDYNYLQRIYFNQR